MKLYAIKENHLYHKAYTKGKKAVGKTVCVYVLPDYHAARLQRENPLKLRINRVGLTATKKLGGAVTRNRVKRILREAYYKLEKTHIIKTGYLVVVAARDCCTNSKTDAVYDDLLHAFEKLDLIIGRKKV